jgi:hypothetical protein
LKPLSIFVKDSTLSGSFEAKTVSDKPNKSTKKTNCSLCLNLALTSFVGFAFDARTRTLLQVLDECNRFEIATAATSWAIGF